MRRECAWCQSPIDGLGPIEKGEPVTSTICPGCQAETEKPMAKTSEKTTPPSKPEPKPKKTRKRRRTIRIEDNAEVQQWCSDFVRDTENKHGYTPTQDQATNAFLVTALRAIRTLGNSSGAE